VRATQAVPAAALPKPAELQELEQRGTTEPQTEGDVAGGSVTLPSRNVCRNRLRNRIH
jgi:hypothetical protein